MNPVMRGKKFAKPILCIACKYAFNILKLEHVYAEIKFENIPSIRTFEGVGFKFKGVRNGLRAYKLRLGDLLW